MGPRVRGDDERWLRRRDTPRGRGRRASVRVLAARMRPSCARRFAREGRGECRVPTHPQPRMQNKKAYELVTTGKAGVPGIPARDGFNGFLRDLPGDRACCHRRFASEQNLTPASRRQDHTTSPSAFSTVRQRCVRVHRIPPRVRDDRERPSVERDGAIRKVFCL
jgi:hypothetical protein